MTILQHMCSQDDPDNDARRPRPARIVKSRPSTKGKEPAVQDSSGEQEQETSQVNKRTPPPRGEIGLRCIKNSNTDLTAQVGTETGTQQPKTTDSKSIGELFSPTRPTLGARLSSWSIRQRAQAPTAEAPADTNNNRKLLRVRSSEPIRRPATPAHEPEESGPEARPTLRTRLSAWSLHQRTGEGLAVLQRISPSYQAYFPSGRLVVG